MADRPILMSAPMVRGLLREAQAPGTGKTQTRRLAWGEDGKPTAWLKLHDAFHYRPIEEHPDYVAGRDGLIYRRRGPYRYRPLKGTQTSKGYLCVSLSTAGVVRTKNVHRLVCEAWYGLAPTERHEVRHIDADRQNNVVGNLDWGSPEQNWADRESMGHGVRSEHHAAKLTPEQVVEIRASSEPQRALAARYGVAQASIWAARNGVTWAEQGQQAEILMPRPAHPRLWVRETGCFSTGKSAINDAKVTITQYRASCSDSPPFGEKWTPSIHMPRWASRLTLVVTEARLEGLQDISEDDAKAEGFSDGRLNDGFGPRPLGGGLTVESPGTFASAGGMFQIAWRKLYPDWDGYSSPEVVAITFTVHERNIDAMDTLLDGKPHGEMPG